MMMKTYFGPKGKLLILLIAVCQLLTTYCSKQLYHDPSFRNVESRDENKKLKDFLDAGTEKGIDTGNTRPDEIIKTAQQYLGVPECMGGTDDLRRGDLVFFIRSYKTNRFITHSGIYTGNYKFIHTSSKKGVTITSINDPWWSKKFIFGTRVFD
jgi:murein DD-endopeptidase / murein LD-carboxypeptidase